jgi:hypothetical protein
MIVLAFFSLSSEYNLGQGHTELSQRVVVNARLSLHAIRRIVLGHREQCLIQECIINAVHDVRAIRFLRLLPRNVDRGRCYFVHCHISGMRRNCELNKKKIN